MESTLAEFAHATREVAAGRGDQARLASGLLEALAEVEGFARQLGDDALVSDDAARTWRDTTAETVAALHGAIEGLLTAARAEPVDGEALLVNLASMIEAEARMSEIRQRAEQYQTALREAMERANRVQCVRCGHRNEPGRSACAQCRTPLPSIGVERVETDVIGGETAADGSAFIERLDELLAHADTNEGRAAIVDFLRNLERLYVVGVRQLDTQVGRLPRDHEVYSASLELRARMEGIRQMTEAVRLSAEEGDLAMIPEFRHWLAQQFDQVIDLNDRIAALCSG